MSKSVNSEIAAAGGVGPVGAGVPGDGTVPEAFRRPLRELVDDRLGDGSTSSTTSPVPVYTGGVLAGRTLTQIVAGGSSTCALDSAGLAYC
jgi:hypothetical protein